LVNFETKKYLNSPSDDIFQFFQLIGQLRLINIVSWQPVLVRQLVDDRMFDVFTL